MVYYEPPKRKQAGPSPANLASLPDEILLKIAVYADNAVISSLRITNSNFVGACNTVLSKRNTILYIHPTTSSLRQAVEICEHPLFSKTIEEIVLLGKVPWRELEATFPHIRQLDCANNMTAASVKGRFCAWPHQPYPKRKADRKSDLQEANTFVVNYAPLLTALSDLPRLRALSFRQSVEALGWNQTAQGLIDSHAQSCALPPNTVAHQMHHADVHALFSILSALGHRVASLRVDVELPFAGDAIEGLTQLCKTPPRSALPNPFLDLGKVRDLTSLDLVLDIGTLNEVHALERGLIACAAPTLRHLGLTLVPQHARSQAAVPYDDLSLLSISDVLQFGSDATASRSLNDYFRRLESLSLVYRDPPTPAKCRDTRRRVRPSCQMLDLGTLLDNVRHTLKSVTIHNIILLPQTYGSPGNPKDAHLSVHNAVTAEGGIAYPELEHFEWKFNRYEHDPRCKSEGGGSRHRDYEKFLCGWYLPNCALELYEEVADTLGAELNTGSEEAGSGFGYWDFGKAIMRAREAA